LQELKGKQEGESAAAANKASKKTIEVTIPLAGHNEGKGEGGRVGGQGCRSTVVSSGGGCAGRGSKEAGDIVRTPEKSSVKAKETVRFERCPSAYAITSSTRNSVKERPTKIEGRKDVERIFTENTLKEWEASRDQVSLIICV
jgi:hypothetical protein